MNETQIEYSSENISKYWKILNYSNSPEEKKFANMYLTNFKQKCQNCLQISFQLFNSPYLEDKLISSILIYQHIKENPRELLENKQLFTDIKDYILNKILIPYTNFSKENINEQNNNLYLKGIDNPLIIERICYTMSIILMLGCCSFWPDAVDDMINFGKKTIRHTYLMTIILGNCNLELKELFLTLKQEFAIKSKFIEKKEELINFINTILTNANQIDKILFNKTVELAKNLIIFEVNILNIPNLIKIILKDISTANIDSLSLLLCECIKNSQCKKIEDDCSDMEIMEYDTKMNKDELESISIIIDEIISYVQAHDNSEEDIIFGFGQIFSNITENFVYLFFKKDILSQKIFNLFFYFISHKVRKISQLFFETIVVIKNFINITYKFSNYNENEKVQFSNYLIKICINVINNCKLKKVKTKQDILLDGEYISIINNKNISTNKKIDDDYLLEINEVSIDDYRTAAEDVFSQVFLIFGYNFGQEGVNYFFEQITKDIISLLNVEISNLKEEEILSVEVIIYVIKTISNNFETFTGDRSTLNKFTNILIHSKIIYDNFILSNFLLLIEECSSYYDYNETFHSELIQFLLCQLVIKMKEQEKLETLIQLISTVLLNICDSVNDIYNNDTWEKMYQVYINYYDKINLISLYNLAEALCSSIITQEDETDDEDNNFSANINNNDNENKLILTNDLLINYFNKVIESPIIRINKIGGIISDKLKGNTNIINEIFLNKEKERQLRIEIIKNYNVITRVLKQSSFIEDKIIINKLFENIYSRTSHCLDLIVNEYNKDVDIIQCIMNMLIKCSSYLNINVVENIYPKLNELLIKSFFDNNSNFQCITVLKNIYSILLHHNNNKNTKIYEEIYNNFMKLNRQICSGIMTCSSYILELVQSLSLLFVSIYPSITSVNKNDYVIINDTILLLIEGIKTLCENNVIKNILYAFMSFIENINNSELINLKFNDIIKNVFYAFDHFNQNIISVFLQFIGDCIKYNKRVFLLVLREILDSKDFNYFNEKNRGVIISYVDKFSDKKDKLKKIFIEMLSITKRMGSQDNLEDYEHELININKNIIK